MNQTSQKLVSIFSQTELVTLMTAVGGYMNTKRKMGKPVESETITFNKVLEALLLSNELNAVEVPTRNSGGIGVAEGKLLLANEL
jgi:hypothetical protein